MYEPSCAAVAGTPFCGMLAACEVLNVVIKSSVDCVYKLSA